MLFPWTISLFPTGFYDITPTTTTVKEDSSARRLFCKPPTKSAKFSKRSLPCWSPALYPKGKTRSNAGVESVTALVYDMDHSTKPPQTMGKELKAAGLSYVIYTTWSHRPSTPRYRIILFLSRPLTAQEYPFAWSSGLAHIGYDAGVDRVAKDVSRHYALPAQVEGEEYVSDVWFDGKVLDADKLTEGSEKASSSSPAPKKAQDKQRTISPDFKILVDGEGMIAVGDLMEKGEGKYKCTCPFQDDASPGSAFFRVCANGQAFVYCTSERHTHEGKRFYVTKKKKKSRSSRTAEDRAEWLEEVPERLREYVEQRIAYNAPQGVFYRHSEGAWQIGSPMRKEPLVDHLIGLMTGKCGKPHAQALIDHILSRQVYGFDCQSVGDRIIRRNEVPMLNLYALPTLEPTKGDCPRVKKILRLLCNEDKQVMKWILHWSAALVQNPERRAMVAVVVLSPQQGIGKSLFGRILATVIGEGNSTVVSNKALKDSFNSHYVTKLLVLADEVAVNRGMGNTMAEVKAAITDDRVHCSAPYAARTTIHNRMTWWLTSNKPDPVLIEKDDRRFTVLSPSKATGEYRQMLRDCFDAETATYSIDFLEELQAFSYHLREMAVDWELISRPIATEAKRTLQTISAESLDAFCHELRKHGASHMLTVFPPGPNYPRIADVSNGKVVPTETLYGTYREWCERTGRRNAKPEPLFRASIQSILGATTTWAYLGGQKISVYKGLERHKQQTEGQVVTLHPEG